MFSEGSIHVFIGHISYLQFDIPCFLAVVCSETFAVLYNNIVRFFLWEPYSEEERNVA